MRQLEWRVLLPARPTLTQTVSQLIIIWRQMESVLFERVRFARLVRNRTLYQGALLPMRILGTHG